jgi:MOSC domain-containing protein YiiM
MTADGTAHPEMQLNIMNARVAALVAQDQSRWALAGDQLYVDLNLSGENLPPGTRLEMGTAVVEVTAIPHRGCGKFVERFGVDAMRFVNSKEGRRQNLRGINAKVINGGTVRVNDEVVVRRV